MIRTWAKDAQFYISSILAKISRLFKRSWRFQWFSFFAHRRDVLSVKNSYVYDDGQESEKNDTFEREPFIVHFKRTLTSKWLSRFINGPMSYLFILLITSTTWCGTHNRVRLQFKCVLADNPLSPGEVGRTTGVYVPYSFRTVVWVLLRPTRTR